MGALEALQLNKLIGFDRVSFRPWAGPTRLSKSREGVPQVLARSSRTGESASRSSWRTSRARLAASPRGWQLKKGFGGSALARSRDVGLSSVPLRMQGSSALSATSPQNPGATSPLVLGVSIPGLQELSIAFSQSPPTWPSSLIVTTAVFAVGFPALASGLSLPGIGAAYVLGLLVWRAFGFQGFVTVCLYFAIGTAVTKVRMKQKEAEGIAEKKKGRRGPASVVGSGFAGALCSLAAITLGVSAASAGSEATLFSLLQLGFVASFCTKLSDTTSSEIGKAFGKSTFLVTTLKPVPRGTEGAISLEGTLAGLAAAVFLAALAVGTGEISLGGAVLSVVASQIANFGESYIGATLQDKPGYEWLNNDVVNVINILTGAALAMAIGSLFLL